MSGVVRAGAVVLQGGEPRVSSRDVADHFVKQHGHVLRTIDRLRDDAEGMKQDGDPTAARFWLSNFGESSYLNEQNKEQRAFSITEAGFMVLTMGFTGREALRTKILFIEEFQRMREELARQALAKASGSPARALPAPNAHSEAVGRWIEARCALGPGLRIRSVEAFEDLRAFLKERGEPRPARVVDFLDAVLSRGDVERIRPGNRSTLVGLALRP